MPTSVYIFLACSLLAFLPAYFDHGETWSEIKGEIKKRRKCLLGVKLFSLWAIPILGLIGTAFLGSESIKSDRKDKQRDWEYKEATNELAAMRQMAAGAQSAANKAMNATKPKPLDERLMAFFSALDPNIASDLKTNSVNLIGYLNAKQMADLEGFLGEPDSGKYIRKGAQVNDFQEWRTDGIYYGVNLYISTNLLSGIHSK